jgi:biotin carboxylase
MKKILIVGAGIEQVPAIKIAKEMGHTVLVSDMSAEAPGIQYADKSYIVSTKDYEGNLKIASEERIDGIMTLCSETAIPVVARISSKLGLPGFSEKTAYAATNKGAMREAMLRDDVTMSPFVMATTLVQALDFVQKTPPPWVVKPSDSSGQRGTTFVNNAKDIPEAFEFAVKYSNDNTALIDQFVDGPEINVTALLDKGKITFLSLSNRVTLGAPNFGIAVRHIAPVHLDSDGQKQIMDMSTKAIRAIGLENGIAYPQIIMSKDGPRFMEIAVRIPGGHMREVAMHVSGIDMIKTTIWQSLGIDLKTVNIKTEHSYPSVSIKFITSNNIDINNERVENITGIEEALKDPSVKMCYLRLPVGKFVPELHNSVGRFGSIIVTGNSKKETLLKTDQIFNNIKVNEKSLKEYANYNAYNENIIKY